MANVNAPSGLKPTRHQTGGQIRLSQYSIASGYGTSIFSGDPVVQTGTGKNIAASAAGTTNSIGVFAGVRYVDAQGRQIFAPAWPAGTVATEIVALVYDDPDIVFEAQIDTIAEADVGLLADWALGTGSLATGVSGAYVDSATKATTGTSLRIIGLVPRVDNAYGAYAKVEVLFIEHALRGVVSGVGGV